jgi:hypothetical protein
MKRGTKRREKVPVTGPNSSVTWTYRMRHRVYRSAVPAPTHSERPYDQRVPPKGRQVERH